jgi:hypothetical protein
MTWRRRVGLFVAGVCLSLVLTALGSFVVQGSSSTCLIPTYALTKYAQSLVPHTYRCP